MPEDYPEFNPVPNPEKKKSWYFRLIQWLGNASVFLVTLSIFIHSKEEQPFFANSSWFYQAISGYIATYLLSVYLRDREGKGRDFIWIALLVAGFASFFFASYFLLTSVYSSSAFFGTKGEKSAIQIKMEDTTWSISGRTKYAILYDAGHRSPDTTKIKNEDKVSTYVPDDLAYSMLARYLNYAVMAGNDTAKLLTPAAVKTAT